MTTPRHAEGERDGGLTMGFCDVDGNQIVYVPLAIQDSKKGLTYTCCGEGDANIYTYCFSTEQRALDLFTWHPLAMEQKGTHEIGVRKLRLWQLVKGVRHFILDMEFYEVPEDAYQMCLKAQPQTLVVVVTPPSDGRKVLH